MGELKEVIGVALSVMQLNSLADIVAYSLESRACTHDIEIGEQLLHLMEGRNLLAEGWLRSAVKRAKKDQVQ